MFSQMSTRNGRNIPIATTGLSNYYSNIVIDEHNLKPVIYGQTPKEKEFLPQGT